VRGKLGGGSAALEGAPGGALRMGGGAGAMCRAFGCEGSGGGWLVTGGGWNKSGTLGMVLTGGRGGGREGTRVSLSPGLRGMDGGAGACPLFGLPLLDCCLTLVRLSGIGGAPGTGGAALLGPAPSVSGRDNLFSFWKGSTSTCS